MMKIQRFVLSLTVGLSAFGAGVGLIELGNHVREVFVSPKSEATIKPIELKTEPPVIVLGEFKLPAVVPESEPADDPVHDWDGSADYYLSGKTPKGFEDFDCLSIGTDVWDAQTESRVPIKPYGTIYTLDKNEIGKEYKFSAVNITGKRITIVTRQVKGVSYQFDGKFVDERLKYKNAGGVETVNLIYLKGRLTKWKGGKRIAEAKVNFEIGGC